MPGFSANDSKISFALQAAKGAAAADAGISVGFTGGMVENAIENDRLGETTGSRDISIGYIKSISSQGGAEFYMRADIAVLAFEAALGERNTTGAGPNYTHEITPAVGNTPWLTIKQVIGGESGVTERFIDVVVDELEVSGGDGDPLTCKLTVKGLAGGTFITASFPVTPNVNVMPMLWSSVDATVDSVARTTVRQFSVAIKNNYELSPGNGTIAMVDADAGTREVTGSMTMRFESNADYRKFMTGSGAGTTPSEYQFTSPLNLTAEARTGETLEIDFPQISWDGVSGMEPGDGTLVQTIAFTSEPNGVDPVITVTIVNTVAGTDYDAS